jgi:sugar lactone lactonase YvrE
MAALSRRSALLAVLAAVVGYPLAALHFHGGSAPARVVSARTREVPLETTEFEPDGPMAVNALLRTRVRHLVSGAVPGQETFVIDAAASTRQHPVGYAFSEDGWLSRVDVAVNASQRVMFIGGRVLGARMHPAQPGVIVGCDVAKGLISVDVAARTIAVLSTASDEGDPEGAQEHTVLYCDDVEVARDGAVYFSDASDTAPWRTSDGHWTTMLVSYLDFLRGYGTGRLLRWDPVTRRTTTLLAGLYFANGVTLTAEEDAVLVAESMNSRVIKYWLRPSGRKPAGFSEVLVELPGPPDGISRAADGGLWVAIPTLRSRAMALAAALPPVRWVLGNLPPRFWPGTPPYGLIMKFRPNGAPVVAMHDPHGLAVRFVSAVTEYEGSLYLGQLHGDSVPIVAAV